MTLDQFKHIYFWEYIHRLWGRLIGFAFLLPFLWFLIPRPGLAPLDRAAGGAVRVGRTTGRARLVDGRERARSADRGEPIPPRRPSRDGGGDLSRDAVGGVGTCLLFSRHLRALPAKAGESRCHWIPAFAGMRGEERASRAYGRLRCSSFSSIFTTLVAGAFVAGTRAGYLDNTFPLMEGQFVPPDYWHLTPLWRNWFENLTSVQFDHRVLAETTWFVIAGAVAREPARFVDARSALGAACAVLLRLSAARARHRHAADRGLAAGRGGASGRRAVPAHGGPGQRGTS